MTYRLLRNLPAGVEVIVCFANTGQEDERTLQFINKCDQAFGFNTVWIEADISPQKGDGGKVRVVSFQTASRDGTPFEKGIAKHGVPNRNFPWCSKDLKARPIHRYLRMVGWGSGTYQTAIGIRCDEIDRMAVDAHKSKKIYPLVKWGVDKKHILHWWKQQEFDLELPEHYGNCLWCWKKSLKKHLTLAVERPGCFTFPATMEVLYHDAGPGERDRPRRFFRGNRSALDLLEMSRQPFQQFVDLNFDDSNGCSESCEVPL
jgi:hypothetical protein